MHTIDPSELPEAYNAVDKVLDFMKAKGHENNSQLRGFCTRWADFFFYADTKDANFTGTWDCWELDEAYQMQSNSTGTDIVNVGHYEHMAPIKWSQFIAV